MCREVTNGFKCLLEKKRTLVKINSCLRTVRVRWERATSSTSSARAKHVEMEELVRTAPGFGTGSSTNGKMAKK